MLSCGLRDRQAGSRAQGSRHARTSRVALGGSPAPIRGDGDAGELSKTTSVAPGTQHPSPTGSDRCRGESSQACGSPGLGLGSRGLTKRPGLQRFLRHRSEAAWERPGRGGQCPDLSTNRTGSWHWDVVLSAQPRVGGWPGWPGRDSAWGLDVEQARQQGSQPRASPGGRQPGGLRASLQAGGRLPAPLPHHV